MSDKGGTSSRTRPGSGILNVDRGVLQVGIVIVIGKRLIGHVFLRARIIGLDHLWIIIPSGVGLSYSVSSIKFT